MRIAAVVTGLLFTTSLAFAQDPTVVKTDPAKLKAAHEAITTLKLSKDIDIAIWCASAYVAVAGILEQSGKPDDAKMIKSASDILYAVATPMLTRAGLSDDQAAQLSLDYATVAYAQAIEQAEPAAYDKDQCATVADAASGKAQ